MIVTGPVKMEPPADVLLNCTSITLPIRFRFYLEFINLNLIFSIIVIIAAITKRAQIPFSS